MFSPLDLTVNDVNWGPSPTARAWWWRYNLTSDSGTTINHIYVLFSTSQFTKAAGKVGESGLHELSVNSFLKWMTKARNRDKDMQLKDFVVSIESR